MIPWIELIGYFASALVALTFYMKTMLPLRYCAIGSNVVFVCYAYYNNIYPILLLHLFLFPLNVMRLRQIKRLVKEVGEAATAEFSIEWLIPYMKRKLYEKGSKIFSKGDQANEMLYIQSGRILLTEIDGQGEALGIESGTVIGEVGIFAPNRKRTATATAADDTVVYSVDEEGIIQIYFLNPKFAFYLVKLITQRLIENNGRAMASK